MKKGKSIILSNICRNVELIKILYITRSGKKIRIWSCLGRCLRNELNKKRPGTHQKGNGIFFRPQIPIGSGTKNEGKEIQGIELGIILSCLFFKGTLPSKKEGKTQHISSTDRIFRILQQQKMLPSHISKTHENLIVLEWQKVSSGRVLSLSFRLWK